MLLVAQQPAGVESQRRARGLWEIKKRGLQPGLNSEKAEHNKKVFENNICNLEPHREEQKGHFASSFLEGNTSAGCGPVNGCIRQHAWQQLGFLSLWQCSYKRK